MGIIKRFRELKFEDYISVLKFPFMYIISLFFIKKNKDLILIIESGFEARDNGYWLFKYIKENDDKANVIYVIDFNSPDYNKVKEIGKCIKYKSMKHWIYYLSAGVNVSTQKGGKPNAAVFYLLEVFGILKNKRVFLQHGITINNGKWLYYKNTKFTSFICGAYPEYKAIERDFGYPEGSVKYLGFSRFDNLHSIDVKKDRILIMPSWREWLVTKTDARYKFNEGDNFIESEYYKEWNKFLTSNNLINFLEENDLELIFYPHRNVQQNIHFFEHKSKNIIFANWENYDIQDLLKSSAFLITDYSSVFMDFAYMKKPMLFYQFDYNKFREGQYEEGYFSYENDGFGPVFYINDNSLMNFLKKSYKNNFIFESKYEKRFKKYFKLYDSNNSKRIYEHIKSIIERKGKKDE